MNKTFNTLFVTMLGIGKIKYMPGTFGSLATIIILYFCFQVFEINHFLILFILVLIFIYSFFAVTTHTKKNENKDPGEIVIDEFLGQSIPIYLYEVSHDINKQPSETIIFYTICFVLFRYFDIVKPFPVSYFDKKHKNSFGVIMDDVCAGIYVVLALISFMYLKEYILYISKT